MQNTQPSFDLSNATWSTGPLDIPLVDYTGDTIPDPNAGLAANRPATLGARTGTIHFSVSSGLNLDIAVDNNIDDIGGVNIDPTVTGQPLACDRNLPPLGGGRLPNVTFSASFELWNAVEDEKTMVNGTLSGFVDVGVSQAPSNGLGGSPMYPAGCGGGAGTPKCAPRGVTQLPKPIPSMIAALGLPPEATMVSRFFGIAPMHIAGPINNDVDVNFLLFSMQPVGDNRYFELISVQYLTWPSVASDDPSFKTINTTVKTCPPYYSAPVYIQGVTSNPTYPETYGGTDGLPGFVPEVVRKIVGPSTSGPWDYALDKSTPPDIDGDTIPGGSKGTMGGADRCNLDATGSPAQDTDGDTLTGVCDPDGETPNMTDLNATCDPTGLIWGKGIRGPGNQITPPFSKFQDRDCDGYLNYVDNCPLVSNGLTTDADVQLDTDIDGLGDSCDPAPTIPGDGQGYKTPLPKLPPNGYVDNSNVCNNRWYVGQAVPRGEAGDPFMKYCLAPEATNPATGPAPYTVASPNPAMASARLSGYRDSSNDALPDFWDGFTSAAPAPAGKTTYDYFDTKDTDGDFATNGCETWLGTDALDATSTPGTPSLPGDCNGDGTSDVDSIANAANPIAGTVGNQTGAFNTSGDGYCTDAEMIALGLDPTKWYAHYDVPVPARKDSVGPNGTRDGAISIADVLAVLFYSGANAAGGPGPWPGPWPNGNGVSYVSDKNGDTIPDGRDYDRSPGATPGPPNGSIDISDVLGALAWSGKNCSTKGVK